MKVIYLDKVTGKEVHYGESITFKETGKLSSGYSYESVTTVPIINSTIPYLIEKGVLVQKEIVEKKCKKKANESAITETFDTIINESSLNIHIDDINTDSSVFYLEINLIFYSVFGLFSSWNTASRSL